MGRRDKATKRGRGVFGGAVLNVTVFVIIIIKSEWHAPEISGLIVIP